MPNNQDTYLTADDILSLYKDHLHEIIAFVYNYVKDEEDAKDLTQDIFYKLYEDVQKRKIKNINPRAYLYRTARNYCIDTLRKKGGRTESYESAEFEPADQFKHGSTEDKLIDSIIVDSLYEYIEKNLPEKECTVFKLKYIYNLNLEEISDAVETSISTISRMLTNISKKLEEKFPDIL